MTQYQAVINLDFKRQQRNAYPKLITALIQAGWNYTGTSGMVVSTDDLNKIWMGAEVVSKQAAAAGTLSAFTLHVQLVDVSKRYAAAANHPYALKDVLAKPAPRPKPRS
jgi:hypothetical protein